MDTRKITLVLAFLFVIAEKNGWGAIWKWLVGTLAAYDLLVICKKILEQ